MRTFFVALATALVAVHLAGYALAGEKVTPAYVPEQAQASALAIPDPAAPKPVAVLVIVKCGRIVGVVVTDSTGDLHPLDIEGVTSAKIKAFVESAPKHLTANVGCKADIDDQLMTI